MLRKPWIIAAAWALALSSTALAGQYDNEPVWGHGIYWNQSNDPANFKSNYEYRFSSLPMEGTLTKEKTPWSETYWPSLKGTIAFRWQTNEKVTDYTPPSREQLRRMSPAQIARLSPAEKYDIYMGRYDYPTVKNGAWMAGRAFETWRGICHGWTPAALNHAEPAPITVRNRDGIELRFGSSDIKGLLSYYYAFHATTKAIFVGSSCGKLGLCSKANDVNAGAFHVVLTNQIGLMNEGFGLDRDPGRQVWNQPVYAYRSKLISSSGNRVTVETTVTWAYDGEYPDNMSSWEPTTNTPNHKKETETYKYTLVLDNSGRIIGGEFHTMNPDMLWMQGKVDRFEGDYAGINDLYVPVQPVVAPVPVAPTPVVAPVPATDGPVVAPVPVLPPMGNQPPRF